MRVSCGVDEKVLFIKIFVFGKMRKFCENFLICIRMVSG